MRYCYDHLVHDERLSPNFFKKLQRQLQAFKSHDCWFRPNQRTLAFLIKTDRFFFYFGLLVLFLEVSWKLLMMIGSVDLYVRSMTSL